MSVVKQWRNKFAAAFSGIAWSVTNQSSFRVHAICAVVAMVVAVGLRVDPWRLTAVLFAIAMVFSAEMLNTSIETIVKVLHPEYDERVGHALDAAAGAVLVVAIAAVIIGLVALGPPILNAF